MLSEVERVPRAPSAAIDRELDGLEGGSVGGGGAAAELRFNLARLVLVRRLGRASELDDGRCDSSVTLDELEDEVEASAVVGTAVEREEEVGVADFGRRGGGVVQPAVDEQPNVRVRFGEELANEGSVLRTVVDLACPVEERLERVWDWRRGSANLNATSQESES